MHCQGAFAFRPAASRLEIAPLRLGKKLRLASCSPSLLIFVTFLNADTEQQKRYCGRNRRDVTECNERGEDRKFVTYEADVTGVTCSLRVPRAARHCRLLHKHNHPVHPNPLCRIVYLTRCSFIVKREASRAISFVFGWFNFVL